MIKRLAWVTTEPARGTDEDEAPALAALARLGVGVDVLNWDDPRVEWSSYDRAVLRSPWDYQHRLPEFLGWLESASELTELVNPLEMIRWNLDKRYLGELHAAGIAITPTAFAQPGEDPTFPEGDFVVKPAIGAGSRDAASYGPEQHVLAHAHVARLHAAGLTVLVQPQLASVAELGEWPLVFFGGRFSHAASKRVNLPRGSSITEFFAPEENAPHVATSEQIELAQGVVDAVGQRFGTPTYARVDLVQADDGSPLVLELELIEPSLFIPWADGAANRLAEALAH